MSEINRNYAYNKDIARSITIPHRIVSLVASLSLSAGLFLVNLDHIVLLHLQGLRGLVVVDPATVEQEPVEGGD